jgi:hypothetical protein
MDGDNPVLLAFDAPLGWPSPLGASLVNRVAGQPLQSDIDRAFQRTADLEIQRRLKPRPLKVGADKIARTAHAALALPDEIRHQTGQPIPLAWDREKLAETKVIEVYQAAATLCSLGLRHQGYKKADQESVSRRREIIKRLRERIEIPRGIKILNQNAHVLDAVVCVLAGADFLNGNAVGPGPNHVAAARKEGWIWVREGDATKAP